MIHASDHYVKTRKTRDIRTGLLLTPADVALKLVVTDKTGTTVQAEVSMSYVEAGSWDYTIPGSVFVLGADPWTVEIRVYDSAGVTLRRKARVTENDGY